ncbi:MAG TPA: EF-hand domain-containing protein [Nitrospira sp.]
MEQGLAAQKKVKKQVPPSISAQPSRPSPKSARPTTQSHPPTSIAPTARAERAKSIGNEGKEKSASTKTARHKNSRKVKGKKQTRRKTVVQPRTDLMYHGILEDPGRYDPRPNYRTAGVPNPHTRYLLHDHFQELDHNRDGTIDPIERAVGRLDMDRDLHNRLIQ